ncbi:MAG: peptidoglycan-binding protein [Clostridia bacterium]|nr:peptidoglycan-binding protein [Clostridia bacterium]
MEQKKKSGFLRLLALLAALAVIGGSIFAFVYPSLNKNASFWLPSAFADEWKTLKKGSSGAEVRKAQTALKELGYYSGKTDGNFSKAFEEAVIAFQQDWGLKVTGALDQDTYEMITQDVRDDAPAATDLPRKDESFVVYGEAYSDKDHVAAYLRAFQELPPNYITKKEAEVLGWVSSQGNLWKVAPGKSIGGDRFGNYEGQLPDAKGRKYFECDIDFDGKYRNAKRIIYSSDGLIFYSEDHYSTFEDITREGSAK